MKNEDYDIHEVIEMALSDHTSFQQIEALYGLKESDVETADAPEFKTGQLSSMAATRSGLSDRRAHYKSRRKNNPILTETLR